MTSSYSSHGIDTLARYALVIGNSDYEGDSGSPLSLDQAHHSARRLQEELAWRGFNVSLKLECSADGIRQALRRFVAQYRGRRRRRQQALPSAGAHQPDAELLLLYFCGHGLHVSGRPLCVLGTDQHRVDLHTAFVSPLRAADPTTSSTVVLLCDCYFQKLPNRPLDPLQASIASPFSGQSTTCDQDDGLTVVVAYACYSDGIAPVESAVTSKTDTLAALYTAWTSALLAHIRTEDDLMKVLESANKTVAAGSDTQHEVFLLPKEPWTDYYCSIARPSHLDKPTITSSRALSPVLESSATSTSSAAALQLPPYDIGHESVPVSVADLKLHNEDARLCASHPSVVDNTHWRSIQDLSELCRKLSEAPAGCVASLSNRSLALVADAADQVFPEPWASMRMWPTSSRSPGADASGCGVGAGSDDVFVPRFTLEKAQNKARVLTVAGGGKVLENVTLKLPGNLALVLDERCNGLKLRDMHVHGGLLVCTGSSCNVHLHSITLRDCPLVVMDGAQVTLSSSTVHGHGVCAIAYGVHTTLSTTHTIFRDAAVGVSVQHSASCKGNVVFFRQMSKTGVEVADTGSTATLHTCSIHMAHNDRSILGTSLRSTDLDSDHVLRPLRPVCGVDVAAGGCVHMGHDSQVSGGDHCVSVRSSHVRITNSALSESKRSCMRVLGAFEGALSLDYVTFRESESNHGLEVAGSGTQVCATRCKFLANGVNGVLVEEGASVELSSCVSRKNTGSGFVATTGGRLVLQQSCFSKDDMNGCVGSGEGTVVDATELKVDSCRAVGLHFHSSARAALRRSMSRACHQYSLLVSDDAVVQCSDECRLSRSPCCVRVESAGVLHMSNCYTTDASESHGLKADGKGTVVLAADSYFSANQKGCGLGASHGAFVQLRVCEAEHNKLGFSAEAGSTLLLDGCKALSNEVDGCRGSGPGTTLSARHSISDTNYNGFNVIDGAHMLLVRCTAVMSSWSGVGAHGVNSILIARGCTLSQNVRFGAAISGSQAVLESSESIGSGAFGMLCEAAGGHMDLIRCNVRDRRAYHMEAGGRIQLHSCQPAELPPSQPTDSPWVSGSTPEHALAALHMLESARPRHTVAMQGQPSKLHIASDAASSRESRILAKPAHTPDTRSGATRSSAPTVQSVAAQSAATATTATSSAVPHVQWTIPEARPVVASSFSNPPGGSLDSLTHPPSVHSDAASDTATEPGQAAKPAQRDTTLANEPAEQQSEPRPRVVSEISLMLMLLRAVVRLPEPGNATRMDLDKWLKHRARQLAMASQFLGPTHDGFVAAFTAETDSQCDVEELLHVLRRLVSAFEDYKRQGSSLSQEPLPQRHFSGCLKYLLQDWSEVSERSMAVFASMLDLHMCFQGASWPAAMLQASPRTTLSLALDSSFSTQGCETPGRAQTYSFPLTDSNPVEEPGIVSAGVAEAHGEGGKGATVAQHGTLPTALGAARDLVTRRVHLLYMVLQQMRSQSTGSEEESEQAALAKLQRPVHQLVEANKLRFNLCCALLPAGDTESEGLSRVTATTAAAPSRDLLFCGILDQQFSAKDAQLMPMALPCCKAPVSFAGMRKLVTGKITECPFKCSRHQEDDFEFDEDDFEVHEEAYQVAREQGRQFDLDASIVSSEASTIHSPSQFVSKFQTPAELLEQLVEPSRVATQEYPCSSCGKGVDLTAFAAQASKLRPGSKPDALAMNGRWIKDTLQCPHCKAHLRVHDVLGAMLLSDPSLRESEERLHMALNDCIPVTSADQSFEPRPFMEMNDFDGLMVSSWAECDAGHALPTPWRPLPALQPISVQAQRQYDYERGVHPMHPPVKVAPAWQVLSSSPATSPTAAALPAPRVAEHSATWHASTSAHAPRAPDPSIAPAEIQLAMGIPSPQGDLPFALHTNVNEPEKAEGGVLEVSNAAAFYFHPPATSVGSDDATRQSMELANRSPAPPSQEQQLINLLREHSASTVPVLSALKPYAPSAETDNTEGAPPTTTLVTSLRRISVSYMHESAADSFAESLSECLPLLPHLSVLHLPGNQFTDVGARALAEKLQQLPRLSDVDLSYNDISIEGVEVLESALKSRVGDGGEGADRMDGSASGGREPNFVLHPQTQVNEASAELPPDALRPADSNAPNADSLKPGPGGVYASPGIVDAPWVTASDGKPKLPPAFGSFEFPRKPVACAPMVFAAATGSSSSSTAMPSTSTGANRLLMPDAGFDHHKSWGTGSHGMLDSGTLDDDITAEDSVQDVLDLRVTAQSATAAAVHHSRQSTFASAATGSTTNGTETQFGALSSVEGLMVVSASNLPSRTPSAAETMSQLGTDASEGGLPGGQLKQRPLQKQTAPEALVRFFEFWNASVTCTDGSQVTSEQFRVDYPPTVSSISIRATLSKPLGAGGAAKLARHLREVALPQLSALQLVNTGIEHPGLQALLPSLACLPRLTHLNLQGNKLHQWYMLMPNVQRLTALQHCNLSQNGISQQKLPFLLRHLADLTNLTFLDLSGNPIGNPGAGFVASALKEMPNLESLNLLDTNITKKGRQKVQNAADQMPKLRDLRLPGLSIRGKLENNLKSIKKRMTGAPAVDSPRFATGVAALPAEFPPPPSTAPSLAPSPYQSAGANAVAASVDTPFTHFVPQGRSMDIGSAAFQVHRDEMQSVSPRGDVFGLSSSAESGTNIHSEAAHSVSVALAATTSQRRSASGPSGSTSLTGSKSTGSGPSASMSQPSLGKDLLAKRPSSPLTKVTSATSPSTSPNQSLETAGAHPLASTALQSRSAGTPQVVRTPAQHRSAVTAPLGGLPVPRVRPGASSGARLNGAPGTSALAPPAGSQSRAPRSQSSGAVPYVPPPMSSGAAAPPRAGGGAQSAADLAMPTSSTAQMPPLGGGSDQGAAPLFMVSAGASSVGTVGAETPRLPPEPPVVAVQLTREQEKGATDAAKVLIQLGGVFSGLAGTPVQGPASHLALRGMALEATGISAVCQCLHKLPQVMSLQYSGNSVPIHKLVSGSRSCPLRSLVHLRSLDISHSATGEDLPDLAHELCSLTALTGLDLSDNGVFGIAFESFVNVVVEDVTTKQAAVDAFAASRNRPSIAQNLHRISELSARDWLPDGTIGGGGRASADAEGLLPALSFWPRVRKLNLSGNHISQEAATHCSRLLYQLSSLTELRLDRGGITDSAAMELSNGLRLLKHLEILSVRDCFVCVDGMGAFAGCMQACRELRVFDVSGNPVSEEGILALADQAAVAVRLERLGLARVGIQNEGALQLEQRLRFSKRGLVIDLAGNYIGESGCQELVRNIRHSWLLRGNPGFLGASKRSTESGPGHSEVYRDQLAMGFLPPDFEARLHPPLPPPSEVEVRMDPTVRQVSPAAAGRRRGWFKRVMSSLGNAVSCGRPEEPRTRMAASSPVADGKRGEHAPPPRSPPAAQLQQPQSPAWQGQHFGPLPPPSHDTAVAAQPFAGGTPYPSSGTSSPARFPSSTAGQHQRHASVVSLGAFDAASEASGQSGLLRAPSVPSAPSALPPGIMFTQADAGGGPPGESGQGDTDTSLQSAASVQSCMTETFGRRMADSHDMNPRAATNIVRMAQTESVVRSLEESLDLLPGRGKGRKGGFMTYMPDDHADEVPAQ